MVSLALYQPDIAQNFGTMMRLCACMGMNAHVIDPCGFAWNDAKLRRAGMDYIDHVAYQRHDDWHAFLTWKEQQPKARLLLLTTKAAVPYTDVTFQTNDILMVGRESAGVPEEVHVAADERLLIPMKPPMRSLNVAISASMVLSEALRQTSTFPKG